jgi:hypothetical protein
MKRPPERGSHRRYKTRWSFSFDHNSLSPIPCWSDPEWGPLCMRDMLQNATFSGFFEIEKNSVFGISSYFNEAYVNYTYQHAF